MNKPLSDKQFSRKLNSSQGVVDGFLSAYEGLIRERFPSAIVALEQYQQGEMTTHQAVDFVKKVVHTHLVQSQINKAEEDILRRQEQKPTATSKSGSVGQGKYAIQFFVKMIDERTGNAQIELWTDATGHHTFRAELYQDAMRLVDNRLYKLATGLHATVSQGLNNGRTLTSRIERDEAISRVLKAPRSAVSKSKPQSAPLKNFMSCHNDRSSFSRG